MPQQKNRPQALAALFLAGFALRLLLAAFTAGHPYDVGTFSAWADLLARLGPGDFYTGGFFADYPPGYLLLLWPVGLATRALGLAPLSPGALALLCLPSVLCDLAFAFTLYRLALPRAGQAKALAAAAAALFSPVFLFDCAVWKQVDMVLALLVVWSFLLLCRRRFLPAAALYGAALLAKPQALLYGPVFALGFLLPVFFAENRPARLRAAGRCFGGAALSLGVVLAGAAPFTGSQTPVVWLWEKYFSTVVSYPYASVNAFNLPTLLGGNWQSQDARFLFLPWRSWGILGILLLSAALLWLAFAPGLRGRREKIRPAGAAGPGRQPDLLLLAAFYGCGLFLFAHRMHERYLFCALALLLAAWAQSGDRHTGGLCVLFSLTQFSNMAAVYACAQSDLYLQGRGVRLLGGCTALAGCAGFAALGLLLARQAGLCPAPKAGRAGGFGGWAAFFAAGRKRAVFPPLGQTGLPADRCCPVPRRRGGRAGTPRPCCC